jgi:hypothetical protein
MFDNFSNDTSCLLDSLELLSDGLRRHFDDEWLIIDGCSVHVDDILEQLQRHITQVECANAAFAVWVEAASSMRREHLYEIKPLLASVRRFIAEEFGADGRHMRELGFDSRSHEAFEDAEVDDSDVYEDEAEEDEGCDCEEAN